jgi:hypothetical protein
LFSPASSRVKERVVELPDRMSKDDFLVRQKQMGMTYKEIRRMGGFTEAESTLRGRYRTLTKCREARVRKPEWSEKDVSQSLIACRLSHLLDYPLAFPFPSSRPCSQSFPRLIAPSRLSRNTAVPRIPHRPLPTSFPSLHNHSHPFPPLSLSLLTHSANPPYS